MFESANSRSMIGIWTKPTVIIQHYYRYIFVILVTVFCGFAYFRRNIIEDPAFHTECSCTSLHEDPAANFAKAELLQLDPLNKISSWESLARHHPNLPVNSLNNTQPRCNLMPDVFKIDWTGVHWQRYQGEEEVLLLYSAFYDNRTKTEPAGGAVRILVLVQGSHAYYPRLPWCHLWYEGHLPPVPARVLRAEYVDWQWRSAERLMTFLLTCPATPPWQGGSLMPTAVSLVETPCAEATNMLQVIGKTNSELQPSLLQPPDYDDASSPSWQVGICGPALFYYQEDFSIRLVEWLELVKAIGVSNVFFYTTRGVHPNIEKVLRHYEGQGFVELIDFHYPPPYMDEPLLRRMWTLSERPNMYSLENVYFSDCLLRYKDRYRFLTHFDPDELPVLLHHDSLPQLLLHLAKLTATWPELPPSYKLFWQYFPNDVPGNWVMTTHSGHQHTSVNTMTNSTSSSGSAQSNDSSTNSVRLIGVNELPNYLHILRHDRKLAYDNNEGHRNVKSIYDTRDSTAAISHAVWICAAADPHTTKQTIPVL